MWCPDGKVRSAEVDSVSNTLYLGGQFSYLGPTNPGFSVFDTNYVEQELSIPDLYNVQVVLPYNNGWILGGTFNSFNGTGNAYLVHIDTLGNIIYDMPVVSGSVFSLCISGDTLFLGGDFFNVNGQSRSKIAAWKLSTGTLLPMNYNVGDRVNSIIPNGNKLLIGGRFTMIGATVRWRLAELNRNTNSITTWNPNSDGEVYSMHKRGDSLYVCGGFNNIGGQSRFKLAAVSVSSGTVLGWNPVINNYMSSIYAKDSVLILCGGFTQVNGIPKNYLAAVKFSDGSLVSSWGPALNGFVSGVMEYNDKMFLTGGFTSINSISRRYVGLIDKNTCSTITNFNIITTGTGIPKNVCVAYNRLAFYGTHLGMGGYYCNNFAAIDLNTGKGKQNFIPVISGDVQTILLDSGKLFIGGNIGAVNGFPRGLVACLDTSGALLPWNPNVFGGMGAYVRTLEKTGDTIFIGGNYSQIGGISRPNLGAVNSNTGSLFSWNPSPNYAVYSIKNYNNKLYVAGVFTSISSTSTRKIACYNLPALTITSFNPTPGSSTFSNNIFTMEIRNNKIYVGGNFTTLGGLSRNRLAQIDIPSGSVTSWNPNATVPSPEDVYGISCNNEFVFVVGASGYHGAFPVNSGTLNFNPFFYSGTTPYTFEVSYLKDDFLYIGGSYNYITLDKLYYKPWIVRFCMGPPAPNNFLLFSDSICENSGPYNYSVTPVDSAEYYIWSYSGANVIINDSMNYASLIFLPGATTGVLSVAAYRNCGAGKSITDTIHVFPIPNTTYGSTLTEWCMDDGPILLTGGGPSGGTYSGPGINSNIFDPFVTGSGTFDIVYYYENAGGCFATDTGSITVHPIPVVTLDASDNIVCSNDGLIPLIINPPGGTLFGTGLTGINFDPSSQTPGIYLFTYWYNDSFTCFNSDTTTITVLQADNVNFSLMTDTICINSGIINLSATPAGGVFSGTNVSGNNFDPTGLTPGSYTVVYSYISPNGCETTEQETIVIENCLGLENYENLTFIIYPNPASDEIEYSSEKHISSGKIYSANTSFINTIQVSGTSGKINVDSLIPGIYFLSVLFEDGERKMIKFVIIR
ncbi:MAG: T9SS type A sorting domain-containing protein [Bacteroidota bacterium]